MSKMRQTSLRPELMSARHHIGDVLRANQHEHSVLANCAQQFAGTDFAIELARNALANAMPPAAGLSALARTASDHWKDQLASLQRLSSFALGSGARPELTEPLRQVAEMGHGVAIFAEHQLRVASVADHARELVSETSLQRVLEAEASRLQRAADPKVRFGLLGTAVPEFRDELDRERNRLESFLRQLSGPAGMGLADLSDLQAGVGRHASEFSQLTRIVEHAMGVVQQFGVEDWSTQTLQHVVNGLRWDEILAANQRPEQRPTECSTTACQVRGSPRACKQVDSNNLRDAMALLGLLVAIITALFESGLLQRFDARKQLDTPQIGERVRRTSWATAAIPAAVHAEPQAGSPILRRVPVGAWFRVLEVRKHWVLVEVEAGKQSSIQGWVRDLTVRELQDEVWTRVIRTLCNTGAGGEAQMQDQPAEVPVVVQNAGEDACITYASVLRSLNTHNTRSAYERAYRSFFHFCENAGVELREADAAALLAYLAIVSERDSMPTARQHLIALRKLFDHLQAAGVTARNPALDLRLPRSAPRPTVTADGRDVELLLLEIAGKKEVDARDRAIVTLIAGLGLKVSQLIALTVDAVEQAAEGKLRLRLGPRARSVVVPDIAQQALATYLSVRRVPSHPDAPLFVSTRSKPKDNDPGRALGRGEIYAMLKRRAKACGIPDVSCEKLRNTLR
jgi:integrase/recombinase XerD